MLDSDEYREKMRDINELAGRVFRAELAGDEELANKLNSELKQLRESKSVHLLTESSADGSFSKPVTKRLKTNETSSASSLKAMYENEKFRSVEDQNADFMRLTNKYARCDDDSLMGQSGRVIDDDDGDRAVKSSGRKFQQNVRDFNRTQDAIETCSFCYDSRVFDNHLMIANGEHFLVCVPKHEPLVVNHCFLVPVRHVMCTKMLDENEWAELQDLRRTLCKIFGLEMKQSCVFFETVLSLKTHKHTVIQCVPVDVDVSSELPSYFRKEIDECETEWSQNRKLIVLGNGKTIRNSIPNGLPYFNVSFGLRDGFAHVIEDEKRFPANFAQQILGNVLDLEHSKWRKPRIQSRAEQTERVQRFRKLCGKYELFESGK